MKTVCCCAFVQHLSRALAGPAKPLRLYVEKKRKLLLFSSFFFLFALARVAVSSYRRFMNLLLVNTPAARFVSAATLEGASPLTRQH
jgi:hypothetical protein